MTGPGPRFTEWRQLRIEHGLSLRELESRTGINRGRLSVIERGLQPTPVEAMKITAVLMDLTVIREDVERRRREGGAPC